MDLPTVLTFLESIPMTMNRLLRSFACAAMTMAAVFSTGQAVAQNTANPVYQTFQPELIDGIDDGLATGRPKVRHVYLAAPDVLAVVVDAQAITIKPMVPYQPQPGDQITGSHIMKLGPEGEDYPRYRQLVRDGENIGDLLGNPPTHLRPHHELVGEPLDLAWAAKLDSYTLSAGATSLTPQQVHRKSHPLMREYVRQGGQKSTARHELYLKFDQRLTPGTRYRLVFNDGALARDQVSFTFDDSRLRTEAIHVNQAGYHPDQPRKTALVSMWIGSGGGIEFSDVSTFRVVEDGSGQVALEGSLKLLRAGVAGAEVPEEGKRQTSDDLPMSVYELDFSALDKPGTYRVVLPGVGCSFPFDIAADVYADTTRLMATGYLNQRSGIALGPPHTKYVRPRDMHPDDGFRVHLTDPAIFFDAQRFPKLRGEGNPFARIQASILRNTEHKAAWGGWHDAADADRSILPQNHTRGVHAMLELYESDPEYFAQLKFNLPESDNNIPDLLDEAAWCVDLFRRIQQEDGGIPSAVESVEHPSEPSHLTSLPTALTPPTPQTCHLYAAAASHLAYLMRPFDARRADDLLNSALRAVAWADANNSVPSIYDRNILPARVHENYAMVHLYRATGDAKWHERFKRTLGEVYPDGAIDPNRHPQGGPWGEVIYAFMPADKVDAELQARCKKAIVKAADDLVGPMAQRPFHLDPNPRSWDQRMGEPWSIVAAHRLTGDQRYLQALLDLSAFNAGRNPLNAAYTRGLGNRSLLTFNLDANYMGTALPEGITIFGPFARNTWGGQRTENQLRDVLYPEWKHWPSPASMFEIRYFSLTEFTVGGPMATGLLVHGYLAQALDGDGAGAASPAAGR
jgi:endoglucanase